MAGGCGRSLQRYKDLQDIIAILGIDELSEEDKSSCAGTQDPALPVAALLRGGAVHRPAREVHADRRDDRLVKALTEGEYDHLPEQAFFLVGGIEEAVEQAKQMEAA